MLGGRIVDPVEASISLECEWGILGFVLEFEM